MVFLIYLFIGIVVTTITCADWFIDFITRNLPSNKMIEYYQLVRDDYRYRFNYLIAWVLTSPMNLAALFIVLCLWLICFVLNKIVYFVFNVKVGQ